MLRRPRTRMMAEAVYGPILDPFVTVVVPMYNEADCIADCARSVLGQDFAPLELLVVDDGSADGSAAICESLGVTVLRQDHRGPGTARAVGDTVGLVVHGHDHGDEGIGDRSVDRLSRHSCPRPAQHLTGSAPVREPHVATAQAGRLQGRRPDRGVSRRRATPHDRPGSGWAPRRTGSEISRTRSGGTPW